MDKQALKIEIIEKQSRAFICPCCQTELQFLVGVQVKGVRPAEKSVTPEPQPIEAPPSDEDLALANLEEQGVVQPFIQACEWVSNWSPPKDLRRYLLVFLKNAKKASESQLTLKNLVSEDCHGYLEAYIFQNIVLIIEDGQYRQFMPTEVYKKQFVRKLVTDNGLLQRVKMNADDWRKTRFGYVAGNTFFKALQLESRGAFGSATQSQRV